MSGIQELTIDYREMNGMLFTSGYVLAFNPAIFLV
jgi:hypothetical protein